MSLNFAERMASRFRELPPSRKVDRTREALKIAAVKALEEIGFNQLRVPDIAERAGMSEGVFYNYFDDKLDICRTVLIEFMHYIPTQRQFPVGGERTRFESIRSANLAWFACARANSGLIRCIFQMQDADSEFARTHQRVGRDWHVFALKRVIDHYPEQAVDSNALEILLYALGGMVDEFTRQLWVSPNPDLIDLLEKTGVTDMDLAEMLAIVWHRAIYPSIELPPIDGRISRAILALDEAGHLQRDKATQVPTRAMRSRRAKN